MAIGKTLTESNKKLQGDGKDIERRYSEIKTENPENVPQSETEKTEHGEELHHEIRIEWVIKSLNDGNSSEFDNVMAEMVKARGEEGIDVYHALCRKIKGNGQRLTH